MADAARPARFGARSLAVLLAVATLLATGGAEPAESRIASPPLQPGSVLVFTKVGTLPSGQPSFRHDSIPAATLALRELGRQNGFRVTVSDDSGSFTDASLRRFDAVVFLLTTGDVLDAHQQAAFVRFIRSGGGYVGIHSASDTEHGWRFYAGLVGAVFRVHSSVQQATVVIEDSSSESTRLLPARWTRTDEWYAFERNPRRHVHVLARLDETTYAPGGASMPDHPISWCHRYRGGRSWYTAMGHTAESYGEPLFRAHLLGGILWAARLRGWC